jgi:serine/threonine protein kinase
MLGGVPFLEPPRSSGVRKAQVRAALFRKLEPIKIGRFILLEPLGAGAMGEIYAAYDEQLDRKVALKLVKGGSGLTANADERLLREAQTLAQVSHPNVVQIYEAGTYNGRLFIAMELVRGKTLARWLEAAAQLPRAVRQREILRQFIAAGRGLEAAHAAGLAHRDFKPDNVLVGDDGRVRVVDFGLARAVGDEPDTEVSARSGRDLDGDGDGAARRSTMSRESREDREAMSLGETVTGGTGTGGDAARGAGASHSARAVAPDISLQETVAGEDIVTPAARAVAAEIVRGQTATRREGEAAGDVDARSVPFAIDGSTIHDKSKGRPVAAREPGHRAATGKPGATSGRAGTGDPASSAPKLKAALRLTETGMVMGTPRFMAPEQIRGAIADHRSDQFSFCVALYHALYDAFPFSGKSLWEISDSMASDAVAFAPGVPVASFVRKALHRGLSVEPSQRFAGMGELLAAIEPRRRYLRAWIAALVLIVVALAAVGLRPRTLDPCAAAGTGIDAAWSAERQGAVREAFLRSEPLSAEAAWGSVQKQVDRYVIRWRGEAVSACQATQVAGTQSAELLDKRMLCLDRGRRQLAALVTELGAAAPGTVERAVEATEALPDLEACRRAENLLFGLAPPPVPVAAEVAKLRDQIARASALELLGRYDESLAVARQANTTAEQLGYPPVHAEALAQVARGVQVPGTADARAEAERLYVEALDIAEADRHDQLAVTIWNGLVMLAVKQDAGMAQARAWWRRNAAAVHRIGDGAYEQARLSHALAAIDFRDSKYTDAAGEERRAIAALERVPSHPLELSRYHDALAKALERLGDRDGTLPLHERALAIATQALGPSHLDVIELAITYGWSLKQHGQLDRGRAVLERALADMPARYREIHPDAAKIHSVLSDIDFVQGNLDRAAEHGRASLAIYQRTQSPDHVRLAEAYTNLANVEQRRGNFDRALAMFEEVVGLWRRHVGDDHFQVGLGEGNIAETLVELERYADALPHVKEAERIFDRIGSRVAGVRAWILTVHGEVLVGQGQLGAAVPVLDQALERFGEDATDATNHALAMFTLARALHGLGRDAGRVRSLAEQARTIFTAQGAIDAHYRDAVAHFLDSFSNQHPR